jgi:predicted phage tail protein
MIKIRLHGGLGKQFGYVHKLHLESDTVMEAVRALSVLHSGFREALLEHGNFKVFRGRVNIGEEELELSTEKYIRIVPVVDGAGAGGKIVAGVALIALGAVTGGFGAVAGASFLAYGGAAAAMVGGLGISLALSGVSELLFAPKKVDAKPDESPNKAPSAMFDGPVNTTAEGNCVPIAYGRVKVGGQNISRSLTVEQMITPDGGATWLAPTGITGAGGGGKSAGGTVQGPKEWNDTLRSTQYARTLDLLSEGEIHGPAGAGPIQTWTSENLGTAWARSIELDGTPLMSANGEVNFSGIHNFIAVHGTQIQPVIPGFAQTETVFDVSQQVKYGTPVESSFTDPDADALRVIVAFPALVTTDTVGSGYNPNGDAIPTSVNIAIDVQVDNGGWVPQTIGAAWVPATIIQNGTTSSAGAFGLTVQLIAVGLPDENNNLPNDYRITGSIAWRVNGGAWNVGPPNVVLNQVNYVHIATPNVGPASYELQLFPVTEYRQRAPRVAGPWGESVGETTYEPGAIVEQYYPEERPASTGWGYIAVSSPAQLVQTQYDTISGKTTSVYTRSYFFWLPAGSQYDVRVRKLTPEPTNSKTRNDVVFTKLVSIIDDKLTYPNSAIFGLGLDAAQFSRIPVRAYDIYGVKVKIPSNYNPWTHTYSGAWDGLFVVAWTDNPAWIFYDLLTNARYGLGEFINAANIDKWALYEIGVYCDESVWGSRRFSINTYIQTPREAVDLLREIASTFRGMIYEVGNVLMVAQDRTRAATRQFTNANVIGGEFTYEGAGIDTRATEVVTWWNDPALDYAAVPEFVSAREIVWEGNALPMGIERYPFRRKEVSPIGINNRYEANRYGRAIIASEQLEDEVVRFSVGLDASFLMPGEVIQTSDKNRAGVRHGGRVMGVSGIVLTLDGPVDVIAGVTYEMSLTNAYGVIETHTFVPGSYYQGTDLAIAGLFSFTPAIGSIWVLKRQDVVPELWRVLGVAENDGITASVMALKYNASKYNVIDYLWGYSEPDTSAIETGPPLAPTGLRMTEELYRKPDGKVGVRGIVSWNRWSSWATGFGIGSPPRGYVVQYCPVYDAGGVWGSTQQWVFGNVIQLPETNEISVVLSEILDGTVYSVKVWSVSATGAYCPAPANIWMYVAGKTAPPSNVTGFSVHVDRYGVELSWTGVPDIDVPQTYHAVETDTQTGAWIWHKYVSGTGHLSSLKTVGPRQFYIKAVDELGVESNDWASASVVVAVAEITNERYEITGQDIRVAWSEANTPNSYAVDKYLIQFYDYDAEFNATLVYSEFQYATSLQYHGNYLGYRLHRIWPIDIGGNYGQYKDVLVQVLGPGITTIAIDVINNTVVLRYSTVAGTLPVVAWELKRGNVFETAEVIGTTSSGFSMLTETAGGAKRYWVTPTDSAGNTGTPYSIDANVTDPTGFEFISKIVVLAQDFVITSNGYLDGGEPGAGPSFPALTDTSATMDETYAANDDKELITRGEFVTLLNG